ncbi:MAG: ISL3 family transposase [Sinobacteraceae bacterium]|nr:ISL3 family transposase [Nevskiaceae bacterium]
MAAVIPAKILGLRGQCVKSVNRDDEKQALVFHCNRDRRFAPVAQPDGGRCTVNRRLRRRVQDLPLWGCSVTLAIEYCQIKIGARDRRMEHLPFVDTGMGYTHRFCRFVSQLCRHMSIDAVARYTGLARRTVKAMDQRTLTGELPGLDPGALSGLRYLGVDEVARAKGHDYLTVVYDLETGDLVGVTEGRTKDGLVRFFDALSEECAAGIEAVAMDVWSAFIHAVTDALPDADIVFGRFHIMHNYGKVIDQVRRSEFKKAHADDKQLLAGTRYLLLKNAARLMQCCTLAKATRLAPLRRFADMLARHAVGMPHTPSPPGASRRATWVSG